MRTLRALALRVGMIVAAVILVGACSAPTGIAPGSAAGAAGQVGTAPDLGGPTVDGGRFDAATVTGTPLVVWFWTPF